MEVAREIEQEYYRVKMLWELAVYFPELKEEAIEIARSIKEEGTRRRVLSDLLPQMPQQLISKVLDIAFSLPESQRFEHISISITRTNSSCPGKNLFYER
ncbi:MAG: hypothetical protein GDA44_10125 [Prochloron sp. SP5CPC1]|nr:hypothetical protein [Candidatus Paraprochloron terpiosi SP5CPC1]